MTDQSNSDEHKPEHHAKVPVIEEAPPEQDTSRLERIKSAFAENSESILPLAAVFAVLASISGLCISSGFNFASWKVEIGIATQQTSADQTQAAQVEQSLGYEAMSAYAAQTNVARQDEESALRATLASTAPVTEPTISAPDATATARIISIQIALIEAESAVYEYFDLINRHLYAEAWSRLTPFFQQAFSSGDFASYQGFWQSVDEVAVMEAAGQEVSPNLTRATLIVKLRFFQSGYDWDRIYEYTLERNAVTTHWRISNTILIVP